MEINICKYSGLTMEYGIEACDVSAVLMCLAMATILSPRHLHLHNHTSCWALTSHAGGTTLETQPQCAVMTGIKLTPTTTTTTVLRPFFRDHPGEAVPEENFWTLWCKGRLTEADTQNNRLGVTPSGLTSAHLHHPPFFYRPDALPAAQPTMSKYWKQLAHLD